MNPPELEPSGAAASHAPVSPAMQPPPEPGVVATGGALAQPAAGQQPTVSPSASWNEPLIAQLAAEFGAPVHTDAFGPLLAMGAQRLPADGCGVSLLAEMGVLDVAGAEAATFLHGQLTQDIEHLAPGMARWAGYCSAKGRLMASLRVWRSEDRIRLALSRPLARPIAKRLAMFVLRAKAKVTDASDAFVVFGLMGQATAQAFVAQAQAREQGSRLTVPSAEASSVTARAELVGLPTVHTGGATAIPRWLLIVPAELATATWQDLLALAPAISPQAWRHGEVLSGVPRIVSGTSECFVPQMVNFESVDGVSFTKGCYPGQEVVARSQYLGKLKRRMFLGHGQGALPQPAQDVHREAEGGEPCGQVVMAAPDGAQGFDVLFESQLDAAQAGTVRIGDAVVRVGTLPYALKAID
jgi:folate-binding protein YgfZ